MKSVKYLTFILISLLFISGKKSESPYVFNLKAFEKTIVFIPGDSIIPFWYGEALPYDHPRIKQKIEIESFYISNHEVSNGEYLLYTEEVKKNFPLQYNSVLPDTLVWREKLSYNEEYVDYYFRSLRFQNYPVVGVTIQQAKLYCQWLTKKYMSHEKRKYSNVRFKLPTKHQWYIAARGKLQSSVFSWRGPFLQNLKGDWMANFLIISQAGISWKEKADNGYQGLEIRNYHTNTFGNKPALVKSYPPNDFGLYNMSGNVAEFVQEEGITKGGSWKDPGQYLVIAFDHKYNIDKSASNKRGFRVMMKVKN